MKALQLILILIANALLLCKTYSQENISVTNDTSNTIAKRFISVEIPGTEVPCIILSYKHIMKNGHKVERQETNCIFKMYPDSGYTYIVLSNMSQPSANIVTNVIDQLLKK